MYICLHYHLTETSLMLYMHPMLIQVGMHLKTNKQTTSEIQTNLVLIKRLQVLHSPSFLLRHQAEVEGIQIHTGALIPTLYRSRRTRYNHHKQLSQCYSARVQLPLGSATQSLHTGLVKEPARLGSSVWIRL